MCGIAGFINLSDRFKTEEMRQIANRMADSFKHRGPDDSGVWVDPSGYCAFAHRRLSIIDLSPSGHQPMIHAPTGTAITFNGEIYNYKELRATLEAEGVKFHGTSDTEVLLAGLEREGEAFINKLDGMFAFAYFDPRTHTITLARDIFGEKPLYYARTKDWFAFASELNALTSLPDFDSAIGLDRLTTYLALQYLPSPKTIYNNANKLPPGHVLKLSPNSEEQLSRHFRFKASAQQTGMRSLNDLADELEVILDESVRSRLVSDVPLGAFLSGGVDSSLVSALASKHLQLPLQTFSIGFEGSADSEHEQARAMAQHLQTNHRDQILPLDALTLGEHIATVLDEPNGDTSCLPTWILSRLARKHVTVALSGDGGDELFGGYGRYQSTMQEAAKGGSDWQAGTAYYSPRILVYGDRAIEKFVGFVPEQTKRFLAELRRDVDQSELPLLQRMRETDIENYMPGAVLAKVDRMNMQHALEVRAPYLSRAVTQFAMQMAADDLCTVDLSKRVLKEVAARYIPREWLERPKKGFGLPIQGWGGTELTETVAQLLFDPECKLGQWLDKDHRKRFIDYHRQTPQTYQLWAVFILENWLRSHVHQAA